MKWLFAWFSRIIFLVAFGSSVSYAGGCDIWKLITDSKVEDPVFWDRIAELQNTNRFTEENVKAVLAQQTELSASTGARSVLEAPTPVAVEVSLSTKVERVVKDLQPSLKEDFEVAKQLLEKDGLTSFRANPGRWHAEKMPRYGPNYYSVRLNHGYRVLFEFKGSTSIIKEVSKDIGH